MADPAIDLPPPALDLETVKAALTAPEAPFETEEAVIRGVSFKTYKHAPKNMKEVFQTSYNFADRDFLVFEDDRCTFGAHAKAVHTLAHSLINDYGVKKGDRVAIIARNYPEWAPAFWAGLIIGAIVTPTNSWWTGEEMEYGLEDSGSSIAIVDPEILERIRPHLDNLPQLKHVIVMRATGPDGDKRVSFLNDIIGPVSQWSALDDPGAPDIPLGTDDPCTIMYTSGTTGKPKGALASHRGIITNMFNGRYSQARGLLRSGEPLPDPNDEPPAMAILLSVPFFHATGAFAILTPFTMGGSKIVTMYKWDAGQALGIIEREKITNIGGVPAIAWQVIEHPDRDKYDLSSIVGVSYGGAPSAPELVTQIAKTFKGAAPGNGWGMTETCATATQNFGYDYFRKPDSAGLPGPVGEIKVVSPDGKTLGPNEVGELWCKGPMNAIEYLNKPEATAETFIDGWVVTGDLARIDEEGFVYLVDRAKDMLIRGGENIYCIEVESALYEHEAVMDAAIVGIPHKVLGEEVGAVIQLAPGEEVTTAELQNFVRSKLAAFKVPVEIVFQTEPLLRNANGKIMKRELKELFTPRD